MDAPFNYLIRRWFETSSIWLQWSIHKTVIIVIASLHSWAQMWLKMRIICANIRKKHRPLIDLDIESDQNSYLQFRFLLLCNPLYWGNLKKIHPSQNHLVRIFIAGAIMNLLQFSSILHILNMKCSIFGNALPLNWW